MKILLMFDKDFPINTNKFTKLLNQISNSVKFKLNKNKISLSNRLITKPETFITIQKKISKLKDDSDRILFITTKQYDDNFFFHSYKNLTIFSSYGLDYFTSLPISNGVLYFIAAYLAIEINPQASRHSEVTGCIYDSLWDKRGVDRGMRQVSFCPNCLMRLSNSLIRKEEISILEDLKALMNHLSIRSRWNKDILAVIANKTDTIQKRKTKKKKNEIHVIIASPGDTESERQKLLNSLEINFRKNGHEQHCGFRLIVSGWEDLAPQPGYPQDVVKKNLIDACDFVIAVFKHKLGTPTKDISTGKQRAKSGTSEELLTTLDNKNTSRPIGMAYFYSQAPVVSLDSPEKKNIEKEWKRLSKFKNSIKDKLLYKPFVDSDGLMSEILSDLEKNIIDYIEK